MSAVIPDSHLDLLNGALVVALATVNPDGQPQVTPVWCDYEDGYIRINTTRGRQKDRNMTERPRVTLLAIDPKNPYRYLEVRGEVVDSSEADAVAHMDKLTKVYLGREKYYSGPGAAREGKETRVVYRIKPLKVLAN